MYLFLSSLVHRQIPSVLLCLQRLHLESNSFSIFIVLYQVLTIFFPISNSLVPYIKGQIFFFTFSLSFQGIAMVKLEKKVNDIEMTRTLVSDTAE